MIGLFFEMNSLRKLINTIWNPSYEIELIPLENNKIRRLYDEATETWYFSIVDIIHVLTQQTDFQSARNYWKVLK